ncbi:MAG: hypothetical protein ACJ8E3_06645 [Sphingomicrobium sp.]
MTRAMLLIAAGAVAAWGVAFPALADHSQAQPEAQPTVCKKVVGNTPGSKPYDLCLTKAEWDAKKIADAKDANRIVCHYEEQPGTRFRSSKVCMTAAEWWNQRQMERQAVERAQAQSCVRGGGC